MRYTKAQLAAIQAPLDRPVRVLAPPGSGKTTVIAARYAFLVENGVDPDSIVAVTFSKSMASELLDRIQRRCPRVNTSQVCTIHALCYRILAAEGDTRGVAKEWQIRKTIEEAAAEVHLNAGWQEIRWWLDRSKAAGITSDDNETLERFFLTRLPPAIARQLVNVRWEVDRTLKAQNLLTFPDMLLDIETQLRTNENFRARWQAKFQYIIVDEGQDTSGQAMRILTKLAEPQNQFFIVGDSDQLLYRFSGATPEDNLFHGFDKRYPDGITIKLDRNFRSTRKIVSRASDLIRHNYEPLGPYPSRFLKDVQPRDDAPDGIEFTFALREDIYDEAAYVASEIEAKIQDGRQPADFFVGARTRAQLAPVEGELARRGIPFANACGGSFWNAKHVADVVAYLELAYKESDSAFRRVFDISSKRMRQPFDTKARRKGEYSPNRWLGRQFLDACNGRFRSIYKALNSRQGWRWRAGVQDLLAMLQEIKDALHHRGLCAALEVIIDHYRAYLEAEGLVEADAAENDKLTDLQTIVTTAAHLGEDIDAFLSYVSQCREAASQESWDGKVVLSTVHRLKGLERPIVFGLGWNEELLPHASALGLMRPFGSLPTGEPSLIEDERCIAFVLVTRAKEEVHLTAIRRYRGKPLIPSRFIRELGLSVEEVNEAVGLGEGHEIP